MTGGAHLAVAGDADLAAPTVLVHYGSPHTGNHLAPFSEAAAAAGLRILALARPGYGATPRLPDRDVAASARLALDALDAAGIERFATVGYSGGGPHALAVAALAPDRVVSVATFASPAPYDGTTGWLDGIRDRRGLETALESRTAREEHERSGAFDPESFTLEDLAALDGRWAALGEDAGTASRTSDLGAADDDLAFVRTWGVDLADVHAPVVLVQGDADRIVPPHHARRLADALPRAEVRPVPGAGHIGVLDALRDVLAALPRA